MPPKCDTTVDVGAGLRPAPTPLMQIVSEEVAGPAPSEALLLATAIHKRHGAAVGAILFYGSCLRTKKVEDEVLDFYVLVDSYRAAYSSWTFIWLNAALPPNVFYLEVQDGQKTLRAKYAIISTADFQQAVTPRSVHAIVWGRFCQPFALVYTRDDRARAITVDCAAQAAHRTQGRTREQRAGERGGPQQALEMPFRQCVVLEFNRAMEDAAAEEQTVLGVMPGTEVHP